MFRCERCRSSYSSRHAAAMQNCPRCWGRDGIASPLAFKAFERAEEVESVAPAMASLKAPFENGADGARVAAL